MKTSWLSPDKLEKDTIFKSLIKASKYVRGKTLDIGCGNKPYKELFTKVTDYIGFDQNRKYADVVGNATDLPFDDNSFDSIISTQVMEHINEPQKMSNEMYRVLKKNGYAVLTVPQFWVLHEEPHDYYRYTKYGLRHIFENSGFKIMYIEDRGNWAITLGQMISLFLEPTFNRYFLKYPKRLFQALVQMFFYSISKSYFFTHIKQAPLGYSIVLQKK